MSDAPRGLDPANPIDPAVAAVIRRKASRLVGRAGLRVQDREDVEQQLTLRVLEREGAFDPRRGTWRAFVRRVVDRHGENLVRARRAAKRYAGPLEPLTEEAAAGDGGVDARVLAGDVAVAIAALPDGLRRVAELVRAGTVADAARALGIARATVYARLREIGSRPRFQKLVGNPPTSPDTSRANGE